MNNCDSLGYLLELDIDIFGEFVAFLQNVF